MKLSKHDASSREAASRRDHSYFDSAGIVHERARLTAEEADEATSRLYDLTGRRYRHYLCRAEGCGSWHVCPCPLRPKDLQRWSDRHLEPA